MNPPELWAKACDIVIEHPPRTEAEIALVDRFISLIRTYKEEWLEETINAQVSQK